MVTLGVDLASKAKNTAACLIRWDGEFAEVHPPEIGLTDSDLLELFGSPDTGPDKIGIDAPFGWPVDFVGAIHAHSTNMHWPHVNNPRLRYRRTDLFVWQKTGKVPLAVTADKIAMTAFRAARLLAMVYEAGEDVDRAGKNGRFVEVYPAAALRVWGMTPVIGQLDKVASALASKAGLKLDDGVLLAVKENGDKFDALVAALVTRAAAIGCCEEIPPEDRKRAKREGWIALPKSGSLGRLATNCPSS